MAPLGGFGLVLLFIGEPLLGILLVVVAALIVVFDSWANRGDRRAPQRREADRGDW